MISTPLRRHRYFTAMTVAALVASCFCGMLVRETRAIDRAPDPAAMARLPLEKLMPPPEFPILNGEELRTLIDFNLDRILGPDWKFPEIQELAPLGKYLKEKYGDDVLMKPGRLADELAESSSLTARAADEKETAPTIGDAVKAARQRAQYDFEKWAENLTTRAGLIFNQGAQNLMDEKTAEAATPAMNQLDQIELVLRHALREFPNKYLDENALREKTDLVVHYKMEITEHAALDLIGREAADQLMLSPYRHRLQWGAQALKQTLESPPRWFLKKKSLTENTFNRLDVAKQENSDISANIPEPLMMEFIYSANHLANIAPTKKDFKEDMRAMLQTMENHINAGRFGKKPCKKN